MKTLLFTVLLILSASSFANDSYTCNVTMTGPISAELADLIIPYGSPVETVELENKLAFSMTIASTGRGNTAPQNRMAFALVDNNGIEQKVLYRGSTIFDGMGLSLGLTVDDIGSNQIVRIKCKLQR